MTRKQIEEQLIKWGFHDRMLDEKTLCAYEQLRQGLKSNRIALKEIDHLEMDEQGEVRAVFESGLDYGSGYLLEYETPGE